MENQLQQSAEQMSAINPASIIVPILLVLLVVAVAAVYWLRRRRAQSNNRGRVPIPPTPPRPTPKEPVRPVPVLPDQEEQRRINRLIEQYMAVDQEIKDRKSEAAYGQYFLKYSTVFQTLIGLARRLKAKDMSQEQYWSEVGILLDNSQILRALDPSGAFSVRVERVKTDRQQIARACAGATYEDMQTHLAQQQRVLRGCQPKLDFKSLLLKAGPILQSFGAAYDERDGEACIAASDALLALLDHSNCHCLYADDPAVQADLRLQVNFRDDNPQATELPGLYIREADGSYALIGNCTGTRRVSDGESE